MLADAAAAAAFCENNLPVWSVRISVSEEINYFPLFSIVAFLVILSSLGDDNDRRSLAGFNVLVHAKRMIERKEVSRRSLNSSLDEGLFGFDSKSVFRKVMYAKAIITSMTIH